MHLRCKQQNNKAVYIQCICSSMLLSVCNWFNFSLRKDSLSYNIKFPSFYYSIWEVLSGKRCNTVGGALSGIRGRSSVFQVSGSEINEKKMNKSPLSASVSSSSGSFWHKHSWQAVMVIWHLADGCFTWHVTRWTFFWQQIPATSSSTWLSDWLGLWKRSRCKQISENYKAVFHYIF